MQFIIPIVLVVVLFLVLRFVKSKGLISERLLLTIKQILGVVCVGFLLYGATISGEPKQLMLPAMLGLILIVKLFQNTRQEVL